MDSGLGMLSPLSSWLRNSNTIVLAMTLNQPLIILQGFAHKHMKRIASIIANTNFESSCEQTPEFKSFARKFKNDFENELTAHGFELTKYRVGHFEVSGFFKNVNGDFFYFSCMDVRTSKEPRLLVRTAKNEKDYTGGQNCWLEIKDDMASKFNNIKR